MKLMKAVLFVSMFGALSANASVPTGGAAPCLGQANVTRDAKAGGKLNQKDQAARDYAEVLGNKSERPDEGSANREGKQRI